MIFLFQLKSGRTSAPRLPQAWQTNCCFDVGQAHIVWPLIGADRLRVAALVVLAVDDYAAHAHVAHFGEGDLLRASSSGGHGR